MDIRELTELIDGLPEKSTPEFIARTIIEGEKIHNAIRDVRCLIRAAESRAKIESSELNDRLRAIVKTCKHQSKKHHSDPSGNNDSWRECMICGSEV